MPDKKEKIFVYIFHEGKTGNGYIQIDNDLDTLQSLVKGYIQIVTVRIKGKDYLVICDEEGKLKGKKPTIAVPMYGVLVGDCVIARKGSDGEIASLDESDILVIQDEFVF